MTVHDIGLRRIVLSGAIAGAAIGGTIATVANGKSGPAFWAGLAVGAILGPIIVATLVSVVSFVDSVRRRTHHSS